MGPYRVFIATEVIEFLKRCPRGQQFIVAQFCDSLRKDPFKLGDYIERDDAGRPIQAAVVGRYVVFYWPDHAVKEVKVLDVRAADR